MKAYAHELLEQQGGELRDAAPPAPAELAGEAPPLQDVPSFNFNRRSGDSGASCTPRAGAARQVDSLSDAKKQVAAEALTSRRHFELPPTLSSPKRRATSPSPAEAVGPGINGAVHPHLRTSIGGLLACLPACLPACLLVRRERWLGSCVLLRRRC